MKQSLGVGMLRVVEDLDDVALLGHCAQVHDYYIVGHFRHHGKIVEMSDTYVAVIEIVSDGTEDGWVERPRTIKLTGM